MHIGLAFALSRLTFWFYFDAGVKWTSDPVVPQIQAMLLLIGQFIAAMIFVPVGTFGGKLSGAGLLVAIAWPLAYAALPFLLSNFFAWFAAAIGLFITGLALARKKAVPDGA
jgi:hypothetical protein